MSDRTQDKVKDAAESAKKDVQSAGASVADKCKEGIDKVCPRLCNIKVSNLFGCYLHDDDVNLTYAVFCS